MVQHQTKVNHAFGKSSALLAIEARAQVICNQLGLLRFNVEICQNVIIVCISINFLGHTLLKLMIIKLSNQLSIDFSCRHFHKCMHASGLPCSAPQYDVSYSKKQALAIHKMRLTSTSECCRQFASSHFTSDVLLPLQLQTVEFLHLWACKHDTSSIESFVRIVLVCPNSKILQCH